MFLIVGLGNPGTKYDNNRHNIGFLAVDDTQRRNSSFGKWKTEGKFQGEVCTGTIGSEKAVLLKPITYMNNSGESVQKVAHFYKITPDKIIVLHDELDLPPLKVRIKTGGGNGGHNGLKSMQQCLGTPDFIRVRIGIGHPGNKDKVSPYVLSDFSKKEMPDFELLCTYVADDMGMVMKGEGQRLVNDLALVFPQA
jgi:PTH1 family peptidyl-tRNA hydrolase